ncbi:MULTISPECIES: NAD(P)-dependent alcohol dehydrogenase [unclassified Actinomyces]|uniref:NAD(P)-dependent alcohol dehydrogenase n=1 Tax=unclassified Actinomyces TaxID=2609248 RepID=UPI002017793B|nr:MULTISPECIES: NAD(P)-dependent alcohol dehydrogenase [unclassified Actinomyces]MCL3778051.1 NAD(P)-dependent alcohol dehydrogenase [Actinomyces sp. AC-20-1]MCL3789863.1 NAD(P)-dependent alcohol dehydrogenase [Actinomyces sp. 187325]MCL3792018.1 NAD(P)-dependent alcohol dehydrogenase [Actinomyces sp. 186855]MCL3794720.1 NAD(P)-dependent alcohol dehydrogenase [Actinomyces sp. 217892]
MPDVLAYAADDATTQFHRTTIMVPEPGPKDIYFEVRYAGICHSDIHTARGEWGPTSYPIVPGHEIAGVVTRVGAEVTRYKVGDRVGVGCMVNACGRCGYCTTGYEQFCAGDPDGEGLPGTLWTYGPDAEGEPTAGGYAQGFTVSEDFACRIPESIPFEAAAPLLCAGITTYSPLKRYGAGPGRRVAVVGMGGLGHMAVQISAAMGAETTVISHGRSKEADARRFGATAFYATSEEGALESLHGSFDLIICTVSASDLDYTGLIRTLRPFGTLVDVGLPEHPSSVHLAALCDGNKALAGSQIGGIAETQEMLDFCAEHGLAPQVEVIGGEEITRAYDDVVGSRVRYRYVIDTSTF